MHSPLRPSACLRLFLPALLLAATLALAFAPTLARAQSTFTQRNLTPNSHQLLWSFASGGGSMVAVGNPGRILSSTDGITWTPRSSGTNEWIVAVAYGNGLFVAVGDNGRILRSADGGVSWTYASNLGTVFRLNGIIYAFGKWIAVGESGIILTSTDANTWTSTPSGTTRWLHGLASSGQYLCTVGQAGTILISTDGLTWTPRTANTTKNLEVVTYVNNYFAVVGEAGTYLYSYAGNGAAYWSSSVFNNPPTTANLRAIASGGGSIVAVSDTGEIFSTPSVFSAWTRRASGTTTILNAVGFARDSFFILGLHDVILQSEGVFDGRLANLSTRGQVGTGGNVLISGLVVRGTAPKRILLRAAGPALAAFGLTGMIARPILSLFDGAGRPLVSNTGWLNAPNAAEIRTAARQVGAFAFAENSDDSALLVSLQPGSYTAQVSGGGALGLALLESYDLDDFATMQSRLVNISSRGVVSTDQNIMIPGIATGGNSARLLLVRAVGPALDAFGVVGTLIDPQITVTRTNNPTPVALNDNWSTQLAPAAGNTTFTAADIRDYTARAGAFALPAGSRDAALLFTTSPGANYTVQVSGVANTAGTALVEVYDVTGL
jgi:photosystem II stability/assembly factor-like uncharacterized protein